MKKAPRNVIIALYDEFHAKRRAVNQKYIPQWDALEKKYNVRRVSVFSAEIVTNPPHLKGEYEAKHDAVTAEWRKEWDALEAEYLPRLKSLFGF